MQCDDTDPVMVKWLVAQQGCHGGSRVSLFVQENSVLLVKHAVAITPPGCSHPLLHLP